MSKQISDSEAKRRSAQSKRDRKRQRAAQLLYDRATAGHLLGNISVSTLIRLEKTKQLVVVKPSGSPNGKVYYTANSVHRLAGVEQAAEVA